jgi:hypothetical protein
MLTEGGAGMRYAEIGMATASKVDGRVVSPVYRSATNHGSTNINSSSS